ncbi:hypothetical protein DICPUDRAFT_99413 [Dictyostelium purpureum]|uniref:Suppressor of forked domain-containing protein n=1 Tax=Dictyostelium purpureum TaxID=5786 RepID=F0ZZ12_DICPU|nr:uncharacterized protein DICPUDRAFT_99413 [Dictyostelium purpureum]EGC30809.1 hypothetical protein DICPUDRAFT_99413 [Dictyostelium purpureum]|eukprot:XP_003292652.1 hypothetical protein DICPUDRAFT_99413 [Dictyostelium purpureum]
MTQPQPKKPLFAAYSSNKNPILIDEKNKNDKINITPPSSHHPSPTSSRPPSPPPIPISKNKASAYFNITFDDELPPSPPPSASTSTTIIPSSSSSKKRINQTTYSSSSSSSDSDNSNDNKKRNKNKKKPKKSTLSFLNDDDFSNSDTSSSDNEGFDYKRKKYKREEKEEIERERKDRKKKRIEKDKKYYSDKDRNAISNDLFQSTESNDQYYFENTGNKSKINMMNIPKNLNYNYDNTMILGLKDYKLAFNKKDGFQIENSNAFSSSKNNQQKTRYFKNQPPSTIIDNKLVEKVFPIPNLLDPSKDKSATEIKLVVNQDTNDDNEENETYETKLQRRLLKENSELNYKVEQNPTDIDRWLDLVKFQENFQQFSAKKSRSKFSMYDRQLTIYKNALMANPDSERLTIEYLKLASEIWDQERVLNLWNALIQKSTQDFLDYQQQVHSQHQAHPTIISEDLWREYINFCLSNFNNFTVNKMKETITQVIRKLLIKRRSFKVKEKNFMERVQVVEESILQFLSQLTRFLHQAGYSERVVGIYQALIELNCFEPIALSNEPQSVLLKEFKEFWVSNNYAKIGESNSIGWSNAYNQILNDKINSTGKNDGGLEDLDNLSIEEIEKLLKEQEDLEKQSELNQNNNENLFTINESNFNEQNDDDINQDDQDINKTKESYKNKNTPESIHENKFINWGKNEIKKDTSKWLPLNIDKATLNDEMGEENDQDTDRVVLFNDVFDLLFKFVRDEIKIELIFQFLEFLGVPIVLDDKIPPRFPFNHPLRRESINSINENNISLLFKDLQDPKQINTATWYRTFENLRKHQPLSKDRIQFIDSVFKLILDSSNIKVKEKLYISYIHFKATYSMDEAKIYTKQLCEKFKQLIYFDIYASLEIKSNKINESKSIYQTTLQYTNQLIQPNKSSPQQQQQQHQININQQLQFQIDFIYREYLFLELDFIYQSVQKDPQILKRFINNSKQNNGSILDMFTLPIHILQCYIESNYKKYTPTNNNNITIKTRLDYLKFKFNEKYQQYITNHQQHQHTPPSIDFVLCFLVLELIYSGFDKSLFLFNQFISIYFKKFTINHEILTIRFIEIVCKIGKLVNIEPFKIKDLIIKSLDDYYDHPKLITLFLNWEGTNQLINRVRVYFDLQSNKNYSAIFWLFSIRFEINKQGAALRIKSLFEKSIQLSRCKHNFILWKLYIEFELNRGKVNTAKSIYYRAIKELPWSKTIWLLPFTNDKLSSSFSDSEFVDCIKLLKEKGIRLREKPVQ